MSDWPYEKLGKLCDRVSVGHVGPTSEYFCGRGEGVALVRSQNVRPGRLTLEDVAYITPDFHSSLKKSQLRPGDVLVVRVGQNRGDVCRVPDGWTGPLNCANVVFARPREIDSRFLELYLRSSAGQASLISMTTGSAQGVLNTRSVAEVAVPVPPLHVQQRIANLLGAIDDKIEQNRRTGAKLEGLARAVFKAWFVDFEPVKAKAAGATAFPGMPPETFDALPTGFDDSEVGPVPDGWVVGKLGENAHINKSSVRTGQIDGEIEYVDIASVSVGQLGGVQVTSFADAPSRARRRVYHGDTIWSCVRPNRRSYLFIHSPPSNRIVSTGFAVISPKVLGAAYIYEATTQQEFVDYLVANADGSAYPAVRAEHFACANVLIPPQVVRDAFEKVAMPLRDFIAAGDKESAKLATLRDYLLPRLLSGQVRVGEGRTHDH